MKKILIALSMVLSNVSCVVISESSKQTFLGSILSYFKKQETKPVQQTLDEQQLASVFNIFTAKIDDFVQTDLDDFFNAARERQNIYADNKNYTKPMLAAFRKIVEQSENYVKMYSNIPLMYLNDTLNAVYDLLHGKSASTKVRDALANLSQKANYKTVNMGDNKFKLVAIDAKKNDVSKAMLKFESVIKGKLIEKLPLWDSREIVFAKKVYSYYKGVYDQLVVAQSRFLQHINIDSNFKSLQNILEVGIATIAGAQAGEIVAHEKNTTTKHGLVAIVRGNPFLDINKNVIEQLDDTAADIKKIVITLHNKESEYSLFDYIQAGFDVQGESSDDIDVIKTAQWLKEKSSNYPKLVQFFEQGIKSSEAQRLEMILWQFDELLRYWNLVLKELKSKIQFSGWDA